MTRKLLSIGLLVFVTSAGLLAFAPVASAHHPEISAQISCGETGTVVVSFVATSWTTPEADRRVNSSVAVDIVVAGVTTRITTGAFTVGDGYRFGGTATLARPTAGVVVRATALAAFGPQGEYGSQGASRETTVLALPMCPDGATTTAASGTSTTESTPAATPATAPAPTTTTVAGELLVATSSMVVTAPTTTTTSTVTAPPVVEAATVRAADPVVTASRLPETGSHHPARLVGLALGMIGLGLGSCALARRPAPGRPR